MKNKLLKTLANLILEEQYNSAIELLTVIHTLKDEELPINSFNINGLRLLHIAIIVGYTPIILSILSLNNIDINALTPNGCSSLHLAVATDNNEVLEILLKFNNLNLNLQGPLQLTALHMATEQNNIEAVKALLNAGSNTSLHCDNGNTPLDIAMHNNNKNIIDLLFSSAKEPIINDKQLLH